MDMPEKMGQRTHPTFDSFNLCITMRVSPGAIHVFRQKLLPENPFGVEIFKSSPGFLKAIYLRKLGFTPTGLNLNSLKATWGFARGATNCSPGVNLGFCQRLF
ncbi:MAG: hypothetical protein DRR19_09930 [Candidatus Parabeggiatoa sp. nov. 1]|nr:MAG: hypothetical protein DRR19_09930 [Gammaproteobacteria bacterium]